MNEGVVEQVRHPDEVRVLELSTGADEVAEWAATAEFGSGVLTPFGVLDPTALSHRGRVDALVAVERVIRHFQAQQQRLLAAIEADPCPPGPRATSRGNELRSEYLHKQYVREDVGCALRVSFASAQRRLALAADLTERFPQSLAALEAGGVSELHCRILQEHTAPLTDELASAVEARVLPRAAEQTPAQFRASVRRAVTAVAPDEAAEQAEHSAQDRDVRPVPISDQLTGVWAELPALEGATLMARIQADAQQLLTLNDGRTAAQCRADALIALARADALDADGNRGRARRRVKPIEIQVCVALSTLLGCDQQSGELTGPTGRHFLPAEVVRAIAFDPTNIWRRLVTDQRGVLLDYGRTVYTPPAPLDRFVKAKHRTCRIPGCTRRACRCEIDHIRAWADGGVTAECNLWPLCCRHHHLKHDAGWQVRREPDGTATWTTPTGHRYRDPQPAYPIDTTTDPPGPFRSPDEESPPF